MTRRQVNNWLGQYFLLATAAIGGFVLTMKGTPALPIEEDQAVPIMQIIVPLFVGQLTIIVRSFTQTNELIDQEVSVPPWLVKWPPLIAIILMLLGVTRLIILHNSATPGVDGAADLRAMLTFCVTLLNATTIYIVAATANVEKTPELNTDKTGD